MSNASTRSTCNIRCARDTPERSARHAASGVRASARVAVSQTIAIAQIRARGLAPNEPRRGFYLVAHPAVSIGQPLSARSGHRVGVTPLGVDGWRRPGRGGRGDPAAPVAEVVVTHRVRQRQRATAASGSRPWLLRTGRGGAVPVTIVAPLRSMQQSASCASKRSQPFQTRRLTWLQAASGGFCNPPSGSGESAC